MRKVFSLLLIVMLLASITVAQARTFDEILGKFAQGSGVCVLYAHAMALAETDPAAFEKLVTKTANAWRVKLNNNKWAYVTDDEIQLSLKNGGSAGEPDNLLTIYSIGVCKRTGTFDYKNGSLEYGPDWMKLVGSGNWTLYDNGQAEGYHLKEGLERLEKITGPDGRPSLPCTVGFGWLDENTCPKYIDQINKVKLVGGHDFSVSRYDAKRRIVILRNPWCPTELVEAPIDLLLNIPAGIDFMEPADTDKTGCCDCCAEK